MTNQPPPATADPRALLSATRDLTHRVRLAQRGAWFPLLAFAAVTLAAIPFNRYGRHPTHCSLLAGGGYACTIQSALALWYWPVAVLAGYLVVGWFYLRRSHRLGLGSRVRYYVALGLGLTVLVTAWAFWADTHPAFLADTLGLRPGQPPTELIYRIASPAGAIGLALLLLAWIERSIALLGITVLYVVVAVATVGMNWFAQPSPWASLPHLLFDAGTLLVGAVILAAGQHLHRPSRA